MHVIYAFLDTFKQPHHLWSSFGPHANDSFISDMLWIIYRAAHFTTTPVGVFIPDCFQSKSQHKYQFLSVLWPK